MSPSIFINYRQADSYTEADHLADRLLATFEDLTVFKDNDSLREGDDLRKEISTAIEGATVVLCLLGKDWLDHPHPVRRRLNKLQYEKDWVRKELELARDLNKTIIPVLYDDTSLPSLEEAQAHLPESLRFLNAEQKLWRSIRKGSSRDDLEALFRTLQEKFGLKRCQVPDVPPPPENCLDKLPLPEELLGLPDLEEVPSPFPGMNWFDEQHARLFFGRSEEICALYEMIALREARLTLLYGYSGVGKSSLMNAGLFPRLRAKGWTVINERRSKSKSLQDLFLDMLSQAPTGKPVLLALDQLEEAIIDPVGGKDELPGFVDSLQERLKLPGNPHLKVVLGFRKEYLSEVQDELHKRQFTKGRSYEGLFLKPLSRKGLEEAITGAAKNGELADHFSFEMEDGLAAEILERINRDEQRGRPEQASSKAPWLQMQLALLWAIESQAAGELADRIMLTRKIYLDRVWQEGFPKTVLQQLDQLGNSEDETLRRYHEVGLDLAVLRYFTSARNTALTRSEEDLFAEFSDEYERTPGHLNHLLQALQDSWLLKRLRSRTGRSFAQLSHDTLASIIRDAFDQSERPGQRAGRILEAKAKDVLARPEVRRFSESDIDVIEQGLSGTHRIPDALLQKIEQDRQHYLDRRTYDLKLALDAAWRHQENLDHDQAIKSLESAQQTGLERDSILSLAETLPYPIAFLQQRSQLEKAFQLIHSIPGASTKPWKELEDLLRGLPTGSIFPELREWLERQDPVFSTQLRDRFFPGLKEVPGGTYEMGAKGNEQVFKREGPAHQVSVDPFLMGETPVTFWQYGLYCLDTGRSIPRDSGFGKGDRPVINISWYEAISYLNWLSEKLGFEPVYGLPDIPPDPNDLHQGNMDLSEIVNWEADGYRLPTEAEWEFAACVKVEKGLYGKEKVKKYRFGNGKDIIDPDEINFDASSLSNQYSINKKWMKEIRKDMFRAQTTPVKEFAERNRNPYGLLDMSGNVFEWCWDWFAGDLSDQSDKYFEECEKQGVVLNPKGAKSGSYRVVRGGSWYYFAIYCRASFRNRLIPIVRNKAH